jgi:hypothetical protein
VGREVPSVVEESRNSEVRPRTEEKEAERRRSANGGGSIGAGVAGGSRESIRRRSSVGSFMTLVGVDRGLLKLQPFSL